MNKKLNTVWFLLAATVLNLVILIVLAVILGVLAGFIFRSADVESQGLSIMAVLLILFGSIGGTFFLYSRIVRWAVKKWNLENYIEPVFHVRNRKSG